ncbi:MAG TPA: sulfotransferase [Solirubrobacteraceae bacterium]|jgi:hypothetical protein|nr:sulfotransferase [Solirubrobacteraceae bacterium]
MTSNRAVTPIFLFSTARCGSTLLQRILGSYPEIATVSEPWLLIPLVYALRKQGVYAEYEHGTMVKAMEDFCAELPGGQKDFQAEIRRLVMRLYEYRFEPQHRYFLDKTPPYFLIVDEIFELFPDAKFIFLWRNPLAVAASLADWPQGNWGGLYRENLFFGLANLISAYRRNAHRACAVRFEDYVTGDAKTWDRVMAYLELQFRPESLSRFIDVRLGGRMGDKHGVNLYQTLSPEPLTKWHSTLANPLRKEAARRYLSWIGRERLAVMGYDADELYAELNSLPLEMSGVASDAINLAKVLVTEPLHFRARSRIKVGRPSSLRYILGARRNV